MMEGMLENLTRGWGGGGGGLTAQKIQIGVGFLT